MEQTTTRIKTQDRRREIIRYNVTGIITNLILSVLKIVFGIIANAHAVILDGVNSLSDVTSCVLTVISMVVGGKKSSRKFPLGYGRLEYVFSFLITMIIIYLGATSVYESIKELVKPPDPPEYNLPLIVVMCGSLVFKMIYGLMMRRKGKQLDSIAMMMAGTESMGDGLIAISILVAIVVYKTTGLDIEHYLCIAISLLIIFTGIKMIVESVTKIIGERADADYKRRMMNLLLEEDDVLSISNLILHNYGEQVYVGSVDVEVNEDMKAVDISRLSRRLIRRAEGAGLILTSVGISAANLSNPETYRLWDDIIHKVRNYPGIKSVNSFVVEFEEKVMSFYAVLDNSVKNAKEELRTFAEELQKTYPEWMIEILDVIDM